MPKSVNYYINRKGTRISLSVLKRLCETKQWKIQYELKDDEIQICLELIKLYRQHPYAFWKQAGVDAIRDEQWITSVINNQSKLEDWSFVRPRSKGRNREHVYNNMRMTRKGSSNPMVKKHAPHYNQDELKHFTQQAFKEILNKNDIPIRYIFKLLNQAYPNYVYDFSDISHTHLNPSRGYNKKNYILSILLDISVYELIELYKKRRGFFIKKGQQASLIFKKTQSLNGSKLLSKMRVTQPQLILFTMIKSIDNNAELEKSIEYTEGYKCYDIYSPLLNSMIEMHGRVFHDSNKTSVSLYEMCKKNEINDKFKKYLAEYNNYQYIIFWDDQTEQWEEMIYTLFNKKGISYEDAKNKVYETKRSNTSV